jgi:hypothetical protein
MTDTFGVLYVGKQFEGAFAETVLRNPRRLLLRPSLNVSPALPSRIFNFNSFATFLIPGIFPLS